MSDAKRRKERDPNYGQPRQDVWDIRPDKSTELFGNLPPDTTADDYLAYLDRHWDSFAAFAYASYIEQGKGFLLLDWDLSLDAQLGLLSPDFRSINLRERAEALDRGANRSEVLCPVLYVGERSELYAILERSGLIDDRWRKLLDRYDPSLMIVLAVSWGNTAEATGMMMVRTLALPGRMAPARAYVENGRSAEYSFLAGTNQAAVPMVRERSVRAIHVEIHSNPEFRSKLRQVFDLGYQQHGKGAVVVISIGNGGVQPIFVPAADLARVLGATVSDRPFQQAIAIIDMCDPETQVAAVLTSEITGESFRYYAVLLGISRAEANPS